MGTFCRFILNCEPFTVTMAPIRKSPCNPADTYDGYMRCVVQRRATD